MTRVPRQVREMNDARTGLPDNPPVDIRAYREHPAWVLLAEPGAGKTTAFEAEAEATGGVHLRIAEFIDTELDESLRGKTLFLDGLDEIRGGAGSDSTLMRVRSRLKHLGYPPFRIACRAADWYGSSDAEDLKSASTDGQIVVLQLEPLGAEDILTLLRDNHDIHDPHAFVEKAEWLGVDGLLGNPQTLGLLAQAVQGDQGPKTRDETYRLACEKLTEEAQKRHRDKTRALPWSVETLLDAAGQLCAVLLLSDQTGIALDLDRADTRFAPLDVCAPPDPEAAIQSVHSKLFRPDGEERMVPSHRSVAEYLAARWLARQIDAMGMPLGRVMNLLLGLDGRTVAGLRGLYAWLALHCKKAQTRLIEADPLTVVLYGDVKPMPTKVKRKLLAGLRREAERFHGFRWGIRDTHPFGGLADPALRDDFLAVLTAHDHDDASQAFLTCLLDALAEGGTQPELSAVLPEIVRDARLSARIRGLALDIWLKSVDDPSTALTLLDDIRTGYLADIDDELAGILLQHLYPQHVGPEKLLDYLHFPKVPNFLGTYYWFWSHELPLLVTNEHLPDLLDGLVGHAEVKKHMDGERSLNEMADKLLARGVTTMGDAISDERLYAWLGMGADEYGEVRREKVSREAIADWLGNRPDRYKRLLARCFDQCVGAEHPVICIQNQANRLLHAKPPDDLGLWHLERVDQASNDGIAEVHLDEAVNALMHKRGDVGLSLEKLEAWAAAHPERGKWLESRLTWQIPERHLKHAALMKTRQQARTEARRYRSSELQKHLPNIQSGEVRVDLMHQLAGVWMDLYTDTHGATPVERFDSYCENGAEVLAMAEAGFRRCPLRADLPTIEEIVDLSIQQREHFIRRPCLVGMELRWRDGAGEVEALPEETLRRMLAFRLTDGAGNTPEWFSHLVRQRPEWVAGTLIAYAVPSLKAGKELIGGIYPLAYDPDYRLVAQLAAPRLLETFPVRVPSRLLQHLETLLKATLRHAPDKLPALIEQKLSKKALDASQKVYWLATATLLDAPRYEAGLWRHVGKSEVRANLLSGFLGERPALADQDYELSAKMLGKLIERIAPHAEVDWPHGGGLVTDAMRRGEQISALINRLNALATDEAEQEIARLLGLPALHKLETLLEATRHELKQRRREREFRFLLPGEVAQVLANRSPASIADLAALALDLLDDISRDIRQENDDVFRAFWNVENKQPRSQREENLCRDVLLSRLRARLDSLGVDCQPEGDYANDKRVDIRLSYQTRFALPIEIKRDSNDSLWRALRNQLIKQYSTESRAFGYGIYLVLWFGGKGMPGATDKGKKPRSPEELRTRLEAQLDPLERQRIFVRVLDVSWPA